MRAVAFCLLALVVAASAREYPMSQYRSLLQTTALSCEADSSVTLNLVGSGEGRATAQSYCEALADAEKVIEENIKNFLKFFDEEKSNGYCTEAKATEGVEGVATAFASAFAKVTVEVDIDGVGEACGDAFAAGDSLAVSLVQVYLRLTVKLLEEKFPDKTYHTDVATKIDGKVNEATGAATGQAAAAVIASAWASASTEACTTGGFKSDFEKAFAEETTIAVAEIWATVIVELCENFDDASKGELSEWAERTAKSFSDIAGSVKVENFEKISATPGGDASGFGGEIPPCGSGKSVCCNASNRGLDICDCGSGCSLKKGSGGSPGQIVWVDDAIDTDLCLCA